MATVVSDNFNRADGPLGNATTGQAWEVVSDSGVVTPSVFPAWSIVSNMANDQTGDLPTGTPSFTGYALIDSGIRNCIVTATIGEVTAGGGSNNRNWGVNWCFTDVLNWCEVAYSRAVFQWRLSAMIAGSWHYDFIAGPAPVNGDVLKVTVCGDEVKAYLNGVLFIDSPNNVTPFLGTPTGTKQGFSAHGGAITPTLPNARFDDFLVETNGSCTPTYNCTVDGCVDPGDGSGTYLTLAACLTACVIEESYNCVDGVCIDPGDGLGEFSTLEACQASGCTPSIPDGVLTVRFDAGSGSEWYLVPAVVDSGDELRSKNVKSVRVTGKLTNASAMVYGYDNKQPIVTEYLEQGTRLPTNMTTGPQAFTDSAQVAETERKPVNVSNAVLWTVRVSGDDTGQETRDELHEICVEQSEMGVRR